MKNRTNKQIIKIIMINKAANFIKMIVLFMKANKIMKTIQQNNSMKIL